MPAPVPVMLMARELGLGGSERQLAELARALDRSRFAPHAGCFRPHGIRGDELRQAGVPVAAFPVPSFRSPAVLPAAIRMGRYLAEHRIQVVHTFDTPLNVFGVPVARAFGVPVVVASQRANRKLSPAGLRHVLRMTDLLADAVVVNCEAVRRHLIEEERVPASRLRLCYNGIDISRFHCGERTRPPALQDARLVIGTVCALRPEKGLETLLEAFRTLRRAGEGLRLLIVGDGPHRPRLEKLSRQLGVAEDCLFEPATGRVTEWLHAIDIFVLPSLSEALSNSLMEAMACGCAAVASRVGGNPELVRHGTTGMLFTGGDSADLASCLSELSENPSLRRSLADQGARFIRDNFSIEAAARRMGEIYTELLAGRLSADSVPG